MHHTVRYEYLTSPRHAVRISSSVGADTYGLMVDRVALRNATGALHHVDELDLFQPHSKRQAQDRVRLFRSIGRMYLQRSSEWAQRVADRAVVTHADVMGPYAAVHATDFARAQMLTRLPQPYETPTDEQVAAACWTAVSACLKRLGRRCRMEA